MIHELKLKSPTLTLVIYFHHDFLSINYMTNYEHQSTYFGNFSWLKSILGVARENTPLDCKGSCRKRKHRSIVYCSLYCYMTQGIDWFSFCELILSAITSLLTNPYSRNLNSNQQDKCLQRNFKRWVRILFYSLQTLRISCICDGSRWYWTSSHKSLEDHGQHELYLWGKTPNTLNQIPIRFTITCH